MGGTSLLSMMEARMPPGFRFHPRDEELIIDYLAKRISNSRCQMMIDVDLNRVEPWDLPDEACVGGKEWYFYSLKDRKYATGQRTNRATVSGYWKATGKDRPVLVDLSSRGGGGVGGGGGGAVAAGGNSNALVVVGMRKTLVFYKGRAPKGKKTDWVMHEFRMESSKEDDEYYDVATSAGAAASAHPPPSTTLHFPSCRNVVPSPTSSTKEDWVLCRVFYKRRALLVKPNSSSIPPTATATTGTTTTGDNCYDDDTAGSSSGAAVLMDTFMNMEQQPAATPQQHFSLQGYEQVPCFSSSSTAAIISSSSAPPSSSLSASKTSSTAPSSINYPTVAGAFPPFRSFTQLFGLPDVVVSPFLSPMEADQQYNKPPGHFAPPLQQINLLNKTTEAAAPIHMDRRVPSTVVNSSTDNSSGNFINNNQSGVQPMWS